MRRPRAPWCDGVRGRVGLLSLAGRLWCGEVGFSPTLSDVPKGFLYIIRCGGAVRSADVVGGDADGLVESVDVASAGSGEEGLSAAVAADGLGRFAYDVNGIVAVLYERLGEHDEECRFALVDDACREKELDVGEATAEQ